MLKITSKDDKTGQMFIQLHEKDGIKVISDKDILIRSDKDINLMANKIKLKSDKAIYLIK